MPSTPTTRLRTLIAESGLSQVKFAEAFGVDPRSVRRWLAGGAMPKTVTDQLARVVRVEVTAERVHIVLTR